MLCKVVWGCSSVVGVADEEGQVAVIDGAKRCSNDPRNHPRPIDVDGEQICNTSCSTTIVLQQTAIVAYCSFIVVLYDDVLLDPIRFRTLAML